MIKINLSNQIVVKKSEVSNLLPQIRSYLTLANPRYNEALRRNYSISGIPQFIYAYSEDDDYFYSARGYLGLLIFFICKSGLKYQLIDQRRRLPEVDYTFSGNLREYQQKAVTSSLQKHFGILVAPCGAGKTVMACFIIVERKQPTLIIVHTKELLNQWKERIIQYLGIPSDQIGVIGDGKETIGTVTVGMIQTLCKRNLSEINKYFGQIIIDECQHCPASTFLDVVSNFDSYYMLGLSATPYRRDKLTKLIFLTLGNIVAKIEEFDLQEVGARIKPKIIIRETSFDYNYQGDNDYQPMISALVEDSARNRLIASDISLEAKENDNYCLILSDRKAHLDNLAFLLKCQGVQCEILTADIPKKKREAIIKQFDDGSLRIILATGQLVGEGLDIPKLNRLFITTPIRWQGKVKQYVGRALRTAKGKQDVRVYDYVDNQVGILANSYKSRCYNVYNNL